MSLDNITLMLEGLALHVGKASALECTVNFLEKYATKHGLAKDAACKSLAKFDVYVAHQNKTYQRYILHWAHYKQKEFLNSVMKKKDQK